nr:Rad52/Rad22 family DNA repair protein [Salinicoccus roseus]
MSENYYGWVASYVSSQAIMARLDEVLGIDGWEDEYKEFHDGFSCGIRVWFSETKSRTRWDGADPTKQEATKGGFSSALKRAAVKWGVGRYIYEIPEQYVEIFPDRNKGANFYQDKKNGQVVFRGYWNDPKLPSLTGEGLDQAKLLRNHFPLSDTDLVVISPVS